jgi:hypothetical protein
MIRAMTLTAALLAALALGACGKDEGDPIPAGNAEALIRGLETAERQAEQGNCVTLRETTIPVLAQRARKLPSSVGSDTRTTIEDGIAHLQELATDQCNRKQEQQPETTSETTTPSTTTEETTTEETTTSDTTTTETTPTEPTAPPTTTPPTTTAPPDNGGTPPGQQQGQQKGAQP